MARESLKYRLTRIATSDVDDRHTIQGYTRSIREFIEFDKVQENRSVPPVERIQRYERYLEAQDYAPASIHTKLAGVCKGFGVSMADIDMPKRTAGHISRGRDLTANEQGKRELVQERYARSVELQKAVGIRRAELAHLRGGDLVRDRLGYLCVRVTSGKGGKLQLQRILPGNEKTVIEAFKGLSARDRVLQPAELKNHINYHSLRAEVAREAYSYYADRLQADPAYRAQLQKELIARWYELHPEPSARQTQRYVADVMNSQPYLLRGENKVRAIKAGRPIEYDRTALMAVSVYHLSHWRLDVTAVNYMV